ncbi:hypothetical protein [Pseudoduganella aquatica]|uniref:hypothetical protein n=1 Tax=Pseudoduganella aquatica TaxID=2660641 RepID=UPI001E387A1A|nr:hypothetical protein [Pseudoduganella aquatica]
MPEISRSNLKLVLGAAAAAIAAAAAVWGLGDWRPARGVATQAHSEAQPAARGAPGWFSAVGGPPASTAGSSAPEPLARQVDALIATGKPEDAYQAHNLIGDCITFQKLGVIPYFHFPEQREMSEAEKQAEAKVCASLTEQMKRSRIDYLTLAARAGVQGASSRFLMEGPFGDPSALQTRPDDPLVLQWKQQAMEQLNREAAQGDLSSLNTLWTSHMTGTPAVPKDARLAYTYNAAMERIFRMQAPDANGGPYDSQLFSFLKEGLTPEQIAAADAEAGRIAENFRKRFEARKLGEAAAAVNGRQ